MDDDTEHKKPKGTKRCIRKRELVFKNYAIYLLNNKTILKLQQRFRNDCHHVYTEQINNIVLSSDDHKRL